MVVQARGIRTRTILWNTDNMATEGEEAETPQTLHAMHSLRHVVRPTRRDILQNVALQCPDVPSSVLPTLRPVRGLAIVVQMQIAPERLFRGYTAEMREGTIGRRDVFRVLQLTGALEREREGCDRCGRIGRVRGRVRVHG